MDLPTKLSLAFAGVQAAGVAILIYQLWDAHGWRKKESAYNFADVGDTAALQERLYAVLAEFADYRFPERCEPLTAAHIERISADATATFVVNTFLNYMQNLCTASDLGLVSPRSFQVIHAGRVVWWYRVLSPYIADRRITYHNPDIWRVFEDRARQEARHFPTASPAGAGDA